MMSASTAPLRCLPIPLPPVGNETTRSYLQRLATINHIHVDELEEALNLAELSRRCRARPQLGLGRLGILTGYATSRLARALPDLSATSSQGSSRCRPPAPRPACPRCVRRHRGGSITIYLAEHQHVCVRHDIWHGSLGPGDDGPAHPKGPLDVSALPAVRGAQRRHHRLVRHYGSAATTQALSTAVDAWDHGHRHGVLTGHERDWLETLRPEADHVSSQDPMAHAICYPAIVTIASVLASPIWQSGASSRSTAQQAFDEIGRRIRRTVGADYDCHPWKRHPLTHWAEDQQYRRRHIERRVFSNDTSSPADGAPAPSRK